MGAAGSPSSLDDSDEMADQVHVPFSLCKACFGEIEGCRREGGSRAVFCAGEEKVEDHFGMLVPAASVRKEGCGWEEFQCPSKMQNITLEVYGRTAGRRE